MQSVGPVDEEVTWTDFYLKGQVGKQGKQVNREKLTQYWYFTGFSVGK